MRLKSIYDRQAQFCQAVNGYLFLGIIFTTIFLDGCATKMSGNGKPWSPRIYKGDHGKKEMIRDGGSIRCDSPEFNMLYCMSSSDFEAMVSRCLE